MGATSDSLEGRERAGGEGPDGGGWTVRRRLRVERDGAHDGSVDVPGGANRRRRHSGRVASAVGGGLHAAGAATTGTATTGATAGGTTRAARVHAAATGERESEHNAGEGGKPVLHDQEPFGQRRRAEGTTLGTRPLEEWLRRGRETSRDPWKCRVASPVRVLPKSGCSRASDRRGGAGGRAGVADSTAMLTPGGRRGERLGRETRGRVAGREWPAGGIASHHRGHAVRVSDASEWAGT